MRTDVHKASNGRYRAAEGLGDDAAGFFTGGDEGVTFRDAGQQGGDVSGGDDLEKGVGSVVSKPPNFAGGIIERQAFARTKRPYRTLIKALFPNQAEVVLVAEVDEAHDAPEVVDPVGVVEGHAPAVGLGREAAEKEDASAVREEGFEGVVLSGHGRRGRIGVRVRGSVRWRSGGRCGASASSGGEMPDRVGHDVGMPRGRFCRAFPLRGGASRRPCG